MERVKRGVGRVGGGERGDNEGEKEGVIEGEKWENKTGVRNSECQLAGELERGNMATYFEP